MGRPNFAIAGYTTQGEGTITPRATENVHSLSDGISAEFFNILNRANFGTPDMNISDVSAGAITSAYDGRDIQFALKLIW